MKLSLCLASFVAVVPAAAFTISQPMPTTSALNHRQTTSSALNLFGNSNKENSEKKGPGMMDQLAMFKKAQEIANKKKQLDEELAKESWEATSVDGKVKTVFKVLPSPNPMDPNPDYEATSFTFDPEWYKSATPEEISKGVKEAVMSGIEVTNAAVAEKYTSLQAMAFGG
jgi:hypothetical protein